VCFHKLGTKRQYVLDDVNFRYVENRAVAILFGFVQPSLTEWPTRSLEVLFKLNANEQGSEPGHTEKRGIAVNHEIALLPWLVKGAGSGFRIVAE
jgi:hypothetical protein